MNKQKLINSYRFISVTLPLLFLMVIGSSLLVLKGRFPWQDLLYADLILANGWRWIVESSQTDGLIDHLFRSIDFRQGTGETLLASTRSIPNIFDIGVLLQVFMKFSQQTAFNLRYLIFVIICYYSSFRLYSYGKKRDPNFDSDKSHGCVSQTLYRFASPVIISSTIILSPIFYHEVGAFVLFFLFLVPSWFLILSSISEKLTLKNFTIYNSILFLSLGVSDLFIFFNITAIFIAAGFLWWKSLKKFFVLYLYSVLIVAFQYIPLIIEKISPSGSMVSHSGSWTLEIYIKAFLIPLFTSSILVPKFTGPINIFFSAIILMLILQGALVSGNKHIRKTIFIMLLTTAIFVVGGSVLHGVSVFREVLPSAVRYHLAIVPVLFAVGFLITPLESINVRILLLSSFFIIGYFVYTNWHYTIDWHLSIIGIIVGSMLVCLILHKRLEAALKLAPIIAVIIPICIYSINYKLYSTITPEGSKNQVDYRLQQWLSSELQACIKEKIESNPIGEGHPNSFGFIAPPHTSVNAGRNDTLTAIIEQPELLNGRTFNQWRYGVNSWTLKLNSLSGLGLFSWPFTYSQVPQFKEFLRRTHSPYVASISYDAEYRILGMVHLGTCSPPNSGIDPIIKRLNYTHANTVKIYFFPNYGTYYPYIKQSFYTSTTAEFILDSSIINNKNKEWIILPVAYHADLIARDNKKSIKTRRHTSGALEIKAPQSLTRVTLSSKSSHRIVSLANIVMIFLIGLLVVLKIEKKQKNGLFRDIGTC
jgi:hypothetical protein